MKTPFSSRLLLLVLQSLLKQHSHIFHSFSTHSVQVPLTAGFVWIYFWSGKLFWPQKIESSVKEKCNVNITWDKGVASPSDHHDVSNHEMFWSIARYCANTTGHSLRSQHDLIRHFGVPLRTLDGDEGWLTWLTATQMCQELVMNEKTVKTMSGLWLRITLSGVVLTHYGSESTLPSPHRSDRRRRGRLVPHRYLPVERYSAMTKLDSISIIWIFRHFHLVKISVCEQIGFLFTRDNDSSDYSTQEVGQPQMNQNRKRHHSPWLLSPGNTGGIEEEKPVDHYILPINVMNLFSSIIFNIFRFIHYSFDLIYFKLTLL